MSFPPPASGLLFPLCRSLVSVKLSLHQTDNRLVWGSLHFPLKSFSLCASLTLAEESFHPVNCVREFNFMHIWASRNRMIENIYFGTWDAVEKRQCIWHFSTAQFKLVFVSIGSLYLLKLLPFSHRVGFPKFSNPDTNTQNWINTKSWNKNTLKFTGHERLCLIIICSCVKYT